MKRAAALAIAGAGVIAAGAWPARGHGGVATFRVCADPNNLPFSSRSGGGLENNFAELIADDLGKRLTIAVESFAPLPAPVWRDVEAEAGRVGAVRGASDVGVTRSE